MILSIGQQMCDVYIQLLGEAIELENLIHRLNGESTPVDAPPAEPDAKGDMAYLQWVHQRRNYARGRMAYAREVLEKL